MQRNGVGPRYPGSGAPAPKPVRRETYQEGWRDGYAPIVGLPQLYMRPLTYARGFYDGHAAWMRDEADRRRREAWNAITGEIEAARPELV